MTDRQIVNLLLEKDEKGMDELIKGYGPLIRYVIAPILTNPQDQDDCLWEVAAKVWQNADKFCSQAGSWKGWITAISRNTALSFLKQSSKHSAAEIEDNTPSPQPGPDELVIEKERSKAVNDALQQLSISDRALFYRKYYYLQSTCQIARELGMTERAVEGKLYRLKKRLRKKLGGVKDE